MLASMAEAVTTSFRDAGHAAISFEKNDDPVLQDILSSLGCGSAFPPLTATPVLENLLGWGRAGT